MKIRSLAFAFLLMLSLAVLIRAPASALAPLLADRSANRLRLTEPEGSIWSGMAGLSCVLPEGTSVNCGRWAWNLVPEHLAQFRLSLLVRRVGTDESVLVSRTLAGVELEGVAITLPAALAGSIDPKIAALRLGGKLHVSSQKLSAKAGQAKVSWQNMDSGLIPGQVLGDHLVDVAIGASSSSFTITSASGPVALSGGGSVSADGQTSVDVVAVIDPKNTALPSLMSLVGNEFSPGKFRFKMP